MKTPTHLLLLALSLGGLSLADYMEARVCLQKEIIVLACERGTEEDFAALEINISETEQMSTPAQIEDRTAHTIEFYTILARATKNQAMSIGLGHHIHDDQAVVVLVNLVARNVASKDFREDVFGIVFSGHDALHAYAFLAARGATINAGKVSIFFFERAVFGQQFGEAGNVFALVLEIVRDSVPEALVWNEMRRMRGDRHIAARQLVAALRARLHTSEAEFDRRVDRLIIA